MKSRLVLIAAVASAIAAPALAQDWAGPLSPSVMPSWVGQDPIGMALRENSERSGSTASGSATPRRAPTTRPASPTAMRYTPSLERRRANLDNFISRSRGRDPQGAAELERVFAESDFIEDTGRALAPYGLRTDDLADAYTVWWINVWDAANGRSEQTDAATARAVRAQSLEAMNGAPAFLNADDARKQELAETLLIQAMLIASAAEQTKSDPAQSRTVAQSARTIAAQMGLDVSAMTLTPQGFVFD